jgi:hypothetical protein
MSYGNKNRRKGIHVSSSYNHKDKIWPMIKRWELSSKDRKTLGKAVPHPSTHTL